MLSPRRDIYTNLTITEVYGTLQRCKQKEQNPPEDGEECCFLNMIQQQLLLLAQDLHKIRSATVLAEVADAISRPQVLENSYW